MKTQEVLTIAEQELTRQVSRMALQELEQHACNIIRRLGSSDATEQYRDLMGLIIKVIPDTDLSSADKYQKIQSLIMEQVPSSDDKAAIYPRLTIIMTMIVVKKFHVLHGETPSEAILH